MPLFYNIKIIIIMISSSHFESTAKEMSFPIPSLKTLLASAMSYQHTSLFYFFIFCCNFSFYTCYFLGTNLLTFCTVILLAMYPVHLHFPALTISIFISIHFNLFLSLKCLFHQCLCDSEFIFPQFCLLV